MRKLPSAPAGPVDPDPGDPAGPGGPAGPEGPVGPVVPVVPAGPVAPTRPGEPLSPLHPSSASNASSATAGPTKWCGQRRDVRLMVVFPLSFESLDRRESTKARSSHATLEWLHLTRRDGAASERSGSHGAALSQEVTEFARM